MEEEPEVRRCAAPWCERVLVQGEFEPWRFFLRRRHCDKSCAAKHANWQRNRRKRVVRGG
jgi:hypothetical protein